MENLDFEQESKSIVEIIAISCKIAFIIIMLLVGIRTHSGQAVQARMVMKLLAMYIPIMIGFIVFAFVGHWIPLLYWLVLISIFGQIV